MGNGGDENIEKAREILKNVAAKTPTHVQSNMLLSMMAFLSNDKSAMAVAQHKLQGLRTSPSNHLSDTEHTQTGLVLDAIAQRLAGAQGVAAQAQNDILMAPYRPHGWTTLASHDDREQNTAAEMALRVAERAVKRAARGGSGMPADAEELAQTLAGTGKVVDAQKAMLLAPWLQGGWQALAKGVST